MASLQVYFWFILVDVLCILIGIFPHIPGSMCWALWSSLTSRSFPTPSMSAYRLNIANICLLKISYFAWALHLVHNKDELLFAFLTVAQCLLATGHKGELLAARLHRQAPILTKGTALLIMFVLVYSAYRAMPLWCQKEDQSFSRIRIFRNRQSRISSSYSDDSGSTVPQGSTSQSGDNCEDFFSKLCAVFFKNHHKEVQAELTALKSQNARLLLEKQVAALAQDIHRLTAAELSSVRNHLSVFTDSMTDQEIQELLPSTRQGHCDTAKLTIYELSKALASSNASLYAKMANSAHLRSSLTSSNTALATLVHAAMDSGKVTQQLAKDLTAANIAKAEAQHMLAKVESTNRQLEAKISSLTTQLIDAEAWGKHDRHRLLEVCQQNSQLRQENSWLRKLNNTCSNTCAYLRRQTNSAKEQLQSPMAEADCKLKITTTAPHSKSTLSSTSIQTQGQTTASVPASALNKTVSMNCLNKNNAPSFQSVQTRRLKSAKIIMVALSCLALILFGSIVTYVGCSGQVTAIPT